MSADHKRKQILRPSRKEHSKYIYNYITVNTLSESGREFLQCEVKKAEHNKLFINIRIYTLPLNRWEHTHIYIYNTVL